MFSGSITALVTPFTEQGGVDYEALDRLVDYQLENGIDGLAVIGTTGESATMAREEIIAVMSRVIGRVDGRIPIMAGTGLTVSYAEFEAIAAERIGVPLSVIVDNSGQFAIDGVIVRDLAPSDEATSGFFGVSRQLTTERLGPVDAARRSVVGFVEFTGQAVTGLGRFFTPGSLTDFFADSFSFSAEDEPDPTEPVIVETTRDLETRPLDASNPDENRILSIYGAAKAGVGLDGFEQVLL